MRAFSALVALVVASLGAPAAASADELTIYAIPSAHGLSWKSPRSLLWSRLANELTAPRRGAEKRKMGHVMIELKTSSGAHILTGMSTAHDAGSASKLLTKDKIGLGILSHTFKGRLEDKADLERELAVRYKNGSISFARFEIPSATGERLLKYVDEYKERGYDKMYGGRNRPLYGEGGGCTAFGVSFLELAGILTPELTQKWTRNVVLPASLVGGPETGNRVSLRSLLFGKEGRSWAQPGAPGSSFTIYSPQLIHDWIVGQSKRGAGRLAGTLSFRADKRGRAKGVVVDARSVATPSAPIWKGRAARADRVGRAGRALHARARTNRLGQRNRWSRDGRSRSSYGLVAKRKARSSFRPIVSKARRK